MQRHVLLDPELVGRSVDEEVHEVWHAVTSLRKGQELYMEVNAFGMTVYGTFCAKFPELADKVQPVERTPEGLIFKQRMCYAPDRRREKYRPEFLERRGHI